MRMTRIWMTGCMALVLLAAGRWPMREEQDDTQRSQRTRITMTSKYDLDETVRQVERLVHKSGLPVVARAAPRSPASQLGESEVAHVIVLGDQGGRTPVVQADGSPSPELPWRVLIRQFPDGHTEVSMPDPDHMALPDEVEAGTLERMTALPGVLKSLIT